MWHFFFFFLEWNSEAGDLLWEWTRDQVLLAKVLKLWLHNNDLGTCMWIGTLL